MMTAAFLATLAFESSCIPALPHTLLHTLQHKACAHTHMRFYHISSGHGHRSSLVIAMYM